MKTKTFALISLILIVCLFFCSCKKSNPTAPELPKPRASIEITVSPWPFNVDWTWWNLGWNYIYISLNVIVTESNGVGGNVSSIKTEFFKDNALQAQETKEGGRFSGYGSVTVSFTIQVFGPNHLIDKLTVTVSGGDDNGHAFTKTESYSITWGMQVQEF